MGGQSKLVMELSIQAAGRLRISDQRRALRAPLGGFGCAGITGQ
jgi:hypothetical protein